MTTKPIARSIQRTVQARGVADGVGTIVQRTIGGDDLESLDPFLTLDEFRMTKPTSSKGLKNPPSSSSKKEVAGFPEHPHRGFETVTLMLEGHFQHQDFTGRQGTIGPGIVHAEMPYFPEDDTQGKKKGPSSSIWGLQLWVNLPKKHKLCKPQYQDLKDEAIPHWSGSRRDEEDKAQLDRLEGLAIADKDESESKSDLGSEKHSGAQTLEQGTTTKNGHGHSSRSEGISIKVIAGESHGVASKVYTRTPTMYLEIKMQKHQKLTEWIPKEYEGFVYVLQGKARFGSSSQGQQLSRQAIVEGRSQQMLILSPSSPPDRTTQFKDTAETETGLSNSGADADQQEQQTRAPVFQRTSFLEIETADESCHFVLIAGEPCREPVFRQGPFVMNSKEELERTFRDYEEKKRGFERAKDWVSTIGQRAPLEQSSSKAERGKGRNNDTSESNQGSRKKENRRKGY
ncbi:hypothetical protein BG000_009864 [Podila horticola]|nr:hypothetical protein BG000_009864 [Podila horticola]